MNCTKHDSPFRFGQAARFSRIQAVDQVIAAILEKAFGLRHLEELYQTAEYAETHEDFTQKILSSLHIDYQIGDAGHCIPSQGPAIVVANHPFGIIDGVILAKILLGIRSDIKIMANHLLQRIPEVKDLFIGVDPFGGTGSTQRNIQPLLTATRWVKQGGLLLVFPAGEVSHIRLRDGKIIDSPWSPTVGRIIKITRAPVVPVYFHGNNSLLFQIAGLVHPRLRTALLPREISKKARSTVHATIGAPIAFNKLRALNSDQEIIRYLRLRTYMLRDLQQNPKPSITPIGKSDVAQPQQALTPAPSSSLLQCEVAALPASQCLVDHGGMQVYYANSEQIPWIMQEIGRLRELTFRATGEGTGKAQDLDLFDAYYLQLFVWNHETNEVVGAYRLGLADQILKHYGVKGLYSHTLFKYKRGIFEQLNPAIELGRSFVRQEYQRNFAPLMLLWKGIGAFVARHPRYRILFGPVSISNDYQTLSQQLLVDFLRINRFDYGLARQIKPRRPFKHAPRRPWHGLDCTVPADIEAISETIAQIEHDHKGIPVLLKQYLKLGGRLLGFNVDRAFSDTLDGLIMVDLLETDARLLQRYMGKTEADYFLNYHRQDYPRVS